MLRQRLKFVRSVILVIDILIVTVSIFFSLQLRFNFHVPAIETDRLLEAFPVFLTVRILLFFYFKTHATLIRFTSTEDTVRIFMMLALGTLFLGVSNFIGYYFIGHYLIPFSILIIDFFISIFLMTGLRMGLKLILEEIEQNKKDKSRVLIYGAGEAGILTKHVLEGDPKKNYVVAAFLDPRPSMVNQKLEGVRIINANTGLDKILQSEEIDFLIIAFGELSPSRKQAIVDTCLLHDVKVLHTPPMRKWINGALSFNQIKEIKIEELLERDPIKLDQDLIYNDIFDKVILVTGAAGSIGSEIARQLSRFDPQLLILCDQAETPLYELDIELKNAFPNLHYEIMIADVRNAERMENVFRTFKPEIVFHAAAYKHVPMMENNPSESILTNILGTKICADLAGQCGVNKFVFISTDKAVNPTNVMGASKRIAEIYVQSLNKLINKKNSSAQVKFITTRFGNVLGSSGSVIPLFRKQIEDGGPITITDPEVTRFFMTIPEACQLVLEAGAMGNGGEIFIFDMGMPVKIIDLAFKMIRLSGLRPESDIKIIYTGMRPGEKKFEELLNTYENTLPTHHEKIMIAKVREYDFDEISHEVNDLIHLFDSQDNERIVRKMKEIVPEYISNNSEFEKLDMPTIIQG